jgi:myxalamid-type polyketide synthase MxaE and MxaD
MDGETMSPTKQALLAIRALQGQFDALNEPIAIVGMGCRYPGADGVEAFWRLLAGGADAVTEVPPERWDMEALYDPDSAVPGRMTTRWGGFLRRLDEFDAAFFGITPREAPHVDPRQRVILEAAWEALEAAGIPPDGLAGTRTGVFLATLTNDYDHLLFQDLCRAEAFSGSGTANSIVANRISYFLDLRGPSLALDTACSGSLVAIHLACESLRKGESTLALAGGVNLNLMPKSNVFFSKAGALSPVGRCKTFDASADGMVRSDGAGIVVLKRLSQAREDGDPVVAVIRATAVNHDGHSNGIMAPNGEAQIAVLRAAYARAGVSPTAVQYVEAHGTGTRLGDPIEVRALGAVLAPDRDPARRCRLGSVKTNIGHTEAAAGVAGVIKTALALRNRQLPPSLHFREPNPLIPFAALPFDVQKEPGPWPSPEEPLIAGVSAFGFGGTNAHVVLEEAPAEARSEPIEGPWLLPVSARSPEALAALKTAYAEALAGDADAASICYTAAVRRSHLPYRLAVAGRSAEELRRALEDAAVPTSASRRPMTAFVFSGQGSHWRGMGSALYRREPVFRDAMDECARIFGDLAGWRLLEEISGERLDDTRIAQPAIFAVQVALAALWRAWGIVPDVVVGHSLGEVAAAHFAGALSLEDAARVVFHRSRLMKTVEGQGRTAVIGLPLTETRKWIEGWESGLAVAGSNAPATTVVAGRPEAIAELERRAAERGVFCRAIPGVEIAFHSPQMEPLLPELIRELREIEPRAATIPLLSTVTGASIEGTELGAEYWARNLRRPFLFTQATESLLASGCGAVLEVSPHPVLGSSIAQTARQAGAEVAVLASLRRGEDEPSAMLAGLGKLYGAGHAVEWRALYPRGKCVSLPQYPWQRRRYWFDQLAGGEPPEAAAAHPLLGSACEPALSAEPMRVWDGELAPGRPAYLADHRVAGHVVLPGAACLEMALAAASEVWPNEPLAVRDAVFETPLRFEGTDARRVQVALVLRGEEAEFSLFSRGGGSAWVRHATATVGPVEARVAVEGSIPVPVGTEIAAADHYAAMAEQGLDYGPKFRAIERLWRGDGEAWARIQLPAALRDLRYHMHPVVLDAAIQSVAATVGSSADRYLPAGARVVRVFGRADAVFCHARLRGAPGSARLEADLHLFDDAGKLVAHVEGLGLARIASHQPLADALIEEHWIEQPVASGIDAHGRWFLTGAGDELADRLTARGHAVTHALDGSVTAVVHVGGIESALETAQAMLRDAPYARLWLVTDGSLQQSPMEGFALALAAEHPELQPTLVRLEAGAGDRELAEELLRPSPETRIEWRGAERSVARLRRAALPPVEPASFRGDATYLITGGLGALGLASARLLAELGARQLVLTGRNVRSVAIPGAEVRVIAADVSRAADVDRLFESLAAMPPLAGVIHAAGALDDGLVEQQSPERFRKVMAAKVDGAWNLHRRTEGLALDFFVLFSSAASLLGSAGQSNYAAANAYIDALARHRQSRGLPALSINWGAWAGDGMAEDSVRERMAARGVSEIPQQDGLRLLSQLLAPAAGRGGIGVVPIHWPKFLDQFPQGPPPRFSEFAERAAAPRQTFRDRLQAEAEADRPELLRGVLHDALAAVLGFHGQASIARHQRLFDLGMDSLMAVEFRNRLEAELGLHLPATLIFDYPSLDALAEFVGGLLPGCTPESASARELENLSEDDLARLLAAELAEGEVHAG